MTISNSNNNHAVESQNPDQLTLSLQKVIGFTDEDIMANRDGVFTFAQKLRILKKNWLITLAFGVVTFYTLLQIIPMLVDPAFISDAILFTICNFTLMFFIIGSIYISSIGAKGVVGALFERKIEQVDGIAFAVSRTRSLISSERTFYYLEIARAISLEIHKRVYDRWVDGTSARLFYARRTKYLVGVEVLKMPSYNIAV